MFRHQKLAVQKVFRLENPHRADTLTEIRYHFRLFSKPFLFLQMSRVPCRCPCSQLLIFHIDRRMVEVAKTSGNNLLQAGSVREGCSTHSPFRFEYVEGWRLENLWAACLLLEYSGSGKSGILSLFGFFLSFYE